MAYISTLSPIDSLNPNNEMVIRQGTIDYRLRLMLASALSWAKQRDYSYLTDYAVGLTYSNVNQFSMSLGKAYFVKDESLLPYQTTVADPATDTNLTDRPYQEYKETIDYVHDIGSVWFRFDATDPNTLYPWQTWSLITGDASIRLGDGTVNSTTPDGTNTPVVPLRLHNHRIDHTHDQALTAYNGTHTHHINEGANTGTTPTSDIDLTSGTKDGIDTQPAGAHAHAVDVPTFIGSSASAGGNETTMDVRGASVKLNLWVREA